MRITIEKQVLLEALQGVMGAVAQKNTLPILSNILLEAQATTLNITATDLDIGITNSQEADIIEQGSTTTPAKRFLDIIKEYPNTTLQITTKKNNTLLITTQNTTIKILTTPPEEFPNIPTTLTTQTVSIQQNILKQMLTQTAFAMSREETRYVLNGVCMEVQPKTIQLVATDGRRLAIIKQPHQSDVRAPSTIIIPSKTIHELLKTLQEQGFVDIKLTKNQAVFKINNTTIISRLIEGEFPNYQQALPAKADFLLTVSKSVLVPAIKRVALLTTTESQAIKLHVTKNKLTISKTTPDIGEAIEEVETMYAGPEIQIGFNPNYLLDVLKNTNNETVTIELTGPEKPGVFRVGDEYVYIVLPMQII
jgi:DNA polymerase III subunit beta